MLQKPQARSMVPVVGERNYFPIRLLIKFFISPWPTHCLGKRNTFQTRTSISTLTNMASLTASGRHWVNGKIDTWIMLKRLVLGMAGSMSNKAGLLTLSPRPIRVCQPTSLASIIWRLLPALTRLTRIQKARSLLMLGISAGK